MVLSMPCLGFNPLQIAYYNTKRNPNKTYFLYYGIVLQVYTHLRLEFPSYRSFALAKKAKVRLSFNRALIAQRFSVLSAPSRVGVVAGAILGNGSAAARVEIPVTQLTPFA